MYEPLSYPFKQSQVGFAQTTIQNTGTRAHASAYTHIHRKRRFNPCHCLLVGRPNLHVGSVSKMKKCTGSQKWPLHYYIFSSRIETKSPIRRDNYAKTKELVIKVTVTICFMLSLPFFFKSHFYYKTIAYFISCVRASTFGHYNAAWIVFKGSLNKKYHITLSCPPPNTQWGQTGLQKLGLGRKICYLLTRLTPPGRQTCSDLMQNILEVLKPHILVMLATEQHSKSSQCSPNPLQNGPHQWKKEIRQFPFNKEMVWESSSLMFANVVQRLSGAHFFCPTSASALGSVLNTYQSLLASWFWPSIG